MNSTNDVALPPLSAIDAEPSAHGPYEVYEAEYVKEYARAAVLADRQQPKTYRDSADFHSNASTAELAAWQRGWNDCREADRQQRGGDVATAGFLENVRELADSLMGCNPSQPQMREAARLLQDFYLDQRAALAAQPAADHLGGPCLTCGDKGAVGNILNAEPCPDCTPSAPLQPAQSAGPRPVADDAMERALTELVEKIVPGLDTGDLLADARTASKALDRAQPAAPVAEVTHCRPDNYSANHRIKWLTQEELPVGTRLYTGPVVQPAAGAEPVNRQAIIDSFSFLEGIVSEYHYRRIVDTACALAAHKPDGGVDQDHIDAENYRRINTPEIADFLSAVHNEALHQRERWGTQGDAGKADADWFWLIGYLAGKAIRPDTTPEKRLHHIITTAAACLNWHGARVGAYVDMRPGIAEPHAAISAQQRQKGMP